MQRYLYKFGYPLKLVMLIKLNRGIHEKVHFKYIYIYNIWNIHISIILCSVLLYKVYCNVLRERERERLCVCMHTCVLDVTESKQNYWLTDSEFYCYFGG